MLFKIIVATWWAVVKSSTIVKANWDGVQKWTHMYMNTWLTSWEDILGRGTVIQWIKSDLYCWTPKPIPAYELANNKTEFPDNVLRKHLYYFSRSNHLGRFSLCAQMAPNIKWVLILTLLIFWTNKFLSVRQSSAWIVCVCACTHVRFCPLDVSRCLLLSPVVIKNVSKTSSNEDYH